MRARCLWAAGLALLSACGEPPIPGSADLDLRITAGVSEVKPGQGFPLTVVRTWSKDLVPSPWNDKALTPLVVRPLDTRRREDGSRVEETRWYRGFAFTLQDVLVQGAAIEAKPKDGGPLRRATAPPLRVHVVPALDPKNPGPPEIPAEPLLEPFPTSLRWGLAILVLGALAAASARAARRRGARSAPPSTPSPLAPPVRDPQGAALQQLESLRARGGEAAACVEEVSGVLREYVGERFRVRASHRTSEELLHGEELGRALTPSSRALLETALRACDRVKFAAHRPMAEEVGRLVDTAEAFVRATSKDSGASPSHVPSEGRAG